MSVKLPLETASQTAGPYVHIGLAPMVAGNPTRDVEIWNEMAKPDAPGEHIKVTGQIFDGNGHLVRDAFMEFWQADAEGSFQTVVDPDRPFNSYGRAATTFDAGEWAIHTVKPGPVESRGGGVMAPHICMAIFARGINIHLDTRIYFEDEGTANGACPVFNAIMPPERRQTLLANRTEDGYRFDVVLQGENETVFFDF